MTKSFVRVLEREVWCWALKPWGSRGRYQEVATFLGVLQTPDPSWEPCMHFAAGWTEGWLPVVACFCGSCITGAHTI
jgi:hypothetical protein